MSTGRQRSDFKGAPDYDDPAYWDNRFSAGQDVGEWLNAGDMILEAILGDLDDRYKPNTNPRVLHLGPGISRMGSKLQDMFISRRWPGNGIVNVDFSTEAVRMGREAEEGKDASSAMHWMHTDLRSWKDVAHLANLAPFAAVMDKSTSDSIATAEPLSFARTDNGDENLCPTIRAMVEESGATELSLSPVETLAIHLVPLTEIGTMWVALSYSKFRFDDMRVIGRYWIVISRTPLSAQAAEVSSTAHTPEIFHWLYVLRRV